MREKVVESLILVEHTPMTSMLADLLTKGLPICVFQGLPICPFHVFCEESSCFSLLHAHFDVCHYLTVA